MSRASRPAHSQCLAIGQNCRCRLAFEFSYIQGCPIIQGSIRTRAGAQGVQFDKEHPLDWDTLNATRGFCGLGKCYFPSRLSEHEAGQAC
eukprot:scaffold36825_cov62-Phaeocystis_antarctica.AAC.1